MRKLSLVLFAIPLAALIGCSGSGTPGGPGTTHRNTGTGGPGATATNGSHKPIMGKDEGTFTLSMPGGLTGTHVKQGEMKTIKIGVDRAKGFTGEVDLTFSELPKGVTIDPPKPAIPASEKEVTVTLKAAPDAAIGKVDVEVDGKAKEGPSAHNKFTLHVDKK